MQNFWSPQFIFILSIRVTFSLVIEANVKRASFIDSLQVQTDFHWTELCTLVAIIFLLIGNLVAVCYEFDVAS